MKNTLYFGDNLEVLRRYVADESVDLVYLDPPFNSDQNYNVLFQEQDGSRSAAQIHAFQDTWQWDQAAASAYQEIVEDGGQVSLAMQAFHTVLGTSNMLAYLSMMAPRLKELHRVLKPKGSIYLHCDPTACHYLKMLMDAIFSPKGFKNEIVWKRTSAHSASKRFGPNFDTILFYAKTENYTWNPQYTPYDPEYVAQNYKHEDADGRKWRRDNLTGAGVRKGPSGESWRGYDPTAHGRHWASGTHEDRERLLAEGRIGFSASGYPYYKRYLDEMPGVALQAFWGDVPLINNRAAEFLGYPTQKPEALLERIIKASSNEGEVVLDPFCGCGTAVAAAQRLNRQWVGIDITCLAISLIKHRLHNAFGDGIKDGYQIKGEPVSESDARELAASDPYQFQWWALGLVNARPVEQKKGADKGIDGRIFFHDEGDSGRTKQIILSVKAGKLHAPYVRDLRGVVDRENAAMGVLITMDEPTKPMRTEAASAGFYESPWGTKHPRIQIIMVGELLEGKGLDAPPSRDFRTIKKAPRARTVSRDKQHKMFGGEKE